MHVFVTGGTGQTGPAIVSELVGAGHRVTGLARSDAAAARLSALGATPWPGSLDDLDALAAGAARSDGVVHLAFGGDFSDPQAMTRRDVAAIEALGEPLVGTDRPLVVTSGTLVLPAGRVGVETDPGRPDAVAGLRHAGERACLDLAPRGVRAVVVRLAPTVHGPHDHGFVPMLIATARRTGVSAYVGDGTNRWPAVHRLDAAALYRLALEEAPAGSTWHGVAETDVPFRSIAETIGEKLGVPAEPVDPEDAGDHFGNPFMATVYGADVPASSELTRRTLGWAPHHPTLLEDLRHGDYVTAP
ncbi:SDR family oxidoreductase [Luteimicrobium sp. NPDC057192]|uniref:SDR family oxidoreductase n=1 Tax=Luteimicrobium sp. NPDC057192 TaxID=3346042 RepID=UPI00363BB0DB